MALTVTAINAAKPKAKIREAKAKSVETFKAMADEWLGRLEIEGRAPKTLRKMRWLLDLAHPLIGQLPIATHCVAVQTLARTITRTARIWPRRSVVGGHACLRPS